MRVCFPTFNLFFRAFRILIRLTINRFNMGLHNKGTLISRRTTSNFSERARQRHSVYPRVIPHLIGNRIRTMYPSRFSNRLSRVPPTVRIRGPITFALITMFLSSLRQRIRRTSNQKHFNLLTPSICPMHSIIQLHSIFFKRTFRINMKRPHRNDRRGPIPRPLRIKFVSKDFRRFFRIFRFRVTTLTPKRFQIRLPMEITPRYALASDPLNRFLRPMGVLICYLKFRFAVYARRCFGVVMRLPIGTPRHCVLLFLPFFRRKNWGVVKILMAFVDFFLTVCTSALTRLLIVLTRRNGRNRQFLPSSFRNIFSRLNDRRARTFAGVTMVSNSFFNRFLCYRICHSNILTSSIHPFNFQVPGQ